MRRLNKNEKKFLDLISEGGGVAAKDLPRAKRGETIKSLELGGLIHYGPGGWYLTADGEIARSESIAKDTGSIPASEPTINAAVAAAINRGESDYRETVLGQPRVDGDPRRKQLEERTSEERVSVIHDRANAVDRVVAAIRRELQPFSDQLDRKFIVDAIERGVREIREEA